ncbi:MAG: hypothetical protein ABI778_08875 [Ignavibacteriota bacterium]
MRFIILIVFLSSAEIVHGQSWAEIDSSDIFSYRPNLFLKIFFPKGIAEGIALRSYLRSGAWKEYRATHSDRGAMNEIFRNANLLCNDYRRASLLASGLGVFDHRTIPLKLFPGVVLAVPLTLESESDFNERTSNLPEHVYSRRISDRDKLQHFFISAFLSRTLKMNWLVSLLGNAVEVGEDLFIVGGSNDDRDRHANKDGRAFGSQIDAEPLPAPSSSLSRNP